MSPLQQLATRAFLPVQSAITAGAIPGALLGIVLADGRRATLVAGQAQITPTPIAMQSDTWFDLASLTKVLFTTVEILAEVAAGRIDLAAPISTLLPDLRQYDLGCWQRNVTFHQCLCHQTPFPAVAPLYTYGQDPQTLRAFILQREWPPGKAVYSDINFILLGLALERLRGQRLNEMRPGWGLSFTPPIAQTAATEFCQWRGRVMCGEVHDENAYALGGAGHAGLFGKIDSVLDFAQDILRGTGFHPDMLRLMQTPQSQTRTYGWECAYPGWSGGDYCNPSVIGHTGFTGTGLWVDFTRAQAWALLTNRVHPSRHSNSGIPALRRAVGEIITTAQDLV